MIYNNVILKARNSADIDTLKGLLTTQADRRAHVRTPVTEKSRMPSSA